MKHLQAQLLMAKSNLSDTEGRLAKLLEEEKAAHQKILKISMTKKSN